MRVLISAYSCMPGRGSEPGVGWGWVSALGTRCEAVVLTRPLSLELLHAEAQRLGLHVEWVFHPSPGRGSRRHEDWHTRLEYLRWQRSAREPLRLLARERRCDVVHHATMATYWVPAGAAWSGIPFVWGPVGGAERCERSFYPGFGLAGLTFELLRDILRALTYLNPLVRRTARVAQVGLATTPQTAAALRRLGCRRVAVMSQVAFTTEDLQMFASLRRSDRSEAFVSVGRLLHWKGFHLGLEAFAAIASRLPNWRYVIIGSGPFESRLRTLATRLGIGMRVDFVGSLSRAETLHALSRQGVLVHPSLHESGGWVVGEAMGCGLPVVCLDSGGPALLVDDSCGRTVEVTNPRQVIGDLSIAMMELARDADLRRRLGNQAAERVSRDCQWAVRADAMMALYYQLMKASA